MTVAVGTLNLILGAVYTCYGIMTWIDLQRGWRTRGMSHFGLAWLFMAFTCGPHHLEHGLHVLRSDIAGGPLDLAAVLVGLPAGVTWFLLRVEAMRGGAGDRVIDSNARWVAGLPTVSGTYAIGIATAGAALLAAGGTFDARLSPNIALVVLYVMIGALLTRTQLRARGAGLPWSLSGLSLSVVFPTCAVMHGIWVLYAAIGAYDFEGHLFTIDVLGVPAAAYFLWVVWKLGRGTLKDWNRGTRDAQPLSPELMARAELEAKERVGANRMI
ncbi:MAG TPA: hypothetical protein VGA36_01600 [Nitriliruptorales bacterium]